MTKLSATIITKNEEKNIKRCLESLKGVVDEILVLDSGSTDKTLEICKKYQNVRIEHQDWLGFGAQKQKAVELASHPYILSLDSDEELDEKLKKEIYYYMKSPNPKHAFLLNRLTNYCGKWIHHCGWSPDWQLRLFHRDNCKWTERSVHEKVRAGSDIKIRKFKGRLNHYSVYSLNQHLSNIEKYSTLGANELIKKNKKIRVSSAITHGASRFFKMYILKRGYLDGPHGLAICLISMWSVCLKYLKAWGHQKGIWQNN